MGKYADFIKIKVKTTNDATGVDFITVNKGSINHKNTLNLALKQAKNTPKITAKVKPTIILLVERNIVFQKLILPDKVKIFKNTSLGETISIS